MRAFFTLVLVLLASSANAMTDIYADDDQHPIPRVAVLDVEGKRKSGGADLVIVIASPLAPDERSKKRLLQKIENYLGYVASSEFSSRHGKPSPESTSIVVHMHRESHPETWALLEKCKPWVLQNNARLEIHQYMP